MRAHALAGHVSQFLGRHLFTSSKATSYLLCTAMTCAAGLRIYSFLNQSGEHDRELTLASSLGCSLP